MTVMLIYSSGRQHGEAIGEYAANTDTYARHAQENIEQCLALTDDSSISECIAKVIEASNEHERAERDLVAQTEMALWALGMLVVSALMAVVTAIGVWFVWRTLIATQDMARDTRNIGVAQTRAYFVPTGVRVAPQTTNGVISGYSFQPEFRNTGQSPAMVKGFSGNFFISDDSRPIVIGKWPADYEVGAGQKVYAPNVEIEVARLRRMAGEGLLTFIITGQYIDIFSDVTNQVHTVTFAAHVPITDEIVCCTELAGFSADYFYDNP